MGVCKYLRGKEDIDSGTSEQDIDIPGNSSGGLQSFAHPIGASGFGQVFDFYTHFQAKTQDTSRQLKHVTSGLAHSQGGFPAQFACGITISGSPDMSNYLWREEC
jgi:acetyl-CoA C-acetyltransferase